MDVGQKIAQQLSKHAPVILTSLAVLGVGATAYLTGRAAVKAHVKIDEAESKYGTADDVKTRLKERASLVWKLYIPPFLVGAATCGCIIGTHGLHTRRQAALLSVYALTETAFREYKQKVVETIGDTKERKVREEIAKDHIRANPPEATTVIVTGRGEVLFMEAITGRYFWSDMETIRKAQNDINALIFNDMYASHNQFCSKINLPQTPLGDQMGWTTENMLDAIFTPILVEEDGPYKNLPCIVMDYRMSPRSDYYNLH